MKKKKFLSVLLTAMLLAGLPCSAVFSADDDVPVKVQEGHTTVGNVSVKNASYAVNVEAYEADASVTAQGKVSLTNEEDGNFQTYAVRAVSNVGKASADITGDVTATGMPQIGGLYAENSVIKAGGNVSATGAFKSIGVKSISGNVNVGGNVLVKGMYESQGAVVSQKKDFPTAILKVGGGITSKANYTAQGLIAGGNSQITVTKGITAEGTKDNSYPSATGIIVSPSSGKSTIDVTGDVKAIAPSGEATGLSVNQPTEFELFVGSDDLIPLPGSETESVESITRIHGNLISDGEGINSLIRKDLNSKADILVENEIKAKDTSVIFFDDSESGEVVGYSSPDYNVNLTVWKAGINQRGNVAEITQGYFLAAGRQSGRQGTDGGSQKGASSGSRKDASVRDRLGAMGGIWKARPSAEPVAAKDFEKNNIQYIIKFKQPVQGGTLSAVDENGKALAKSFGFPVAKEGEKLVLKASLKSGWKITAAYNGNQKLAKDNKGNYYLTVPKGGGVILSATMEKESYTVKFVDRGNTLKTQQVKYGEAASAPKVAKRTGYTFAGWDKSFGKVTSNLTVTAKWKKNAPKPKPKPINSSKAPFLARLKSKGKNTLVLSWGNVDGAQGYDVFFAKCGKKSKAVYVTTITGNKKRKWVKSNLEE